MKLSFELDIPTKKVQASWDDINDDSNHEDKVKMDMFIDDETANMSEVMRKFAGKKVRFTIETIK